MTDLTQLLTCLSLRWFSLSLGFGVLLLHTPVYAHACICGCTYVWTHVEARDQCRECTSITFHLILETKSLNECGAQTDCLAKNPQGPFLWKCHPHFFK